MARPTTWIKLDRNITRWGWYRDANTKNVFIHLLLKANVETENFLGVPVGRGELATSYPKLAEQLSLSVQEVRTAILHLRSTGEITVKKYPKFSLIVIENYDKYQGNPEEYHKNSNFKKHGNRQNNRQPSSQATGNQQASHRRSTTIKEYNNKINKEYKENKGASPDSPSEKGAKSVQLFDWEKDIPKRFQGRFNSKEEWEEFDR